MSILNFLLQFMISGLVVAGASYLAKTIDPKWSGLLVALPVMTILALIFISLNNDTATTEKYLSSALLFMIPAAVYIAGLYFMYGRFGLMASLLMATLPFLALVYLIQKIT